MTLILSGTDGLSDIDGSAATPAIRGTDANTGIFFGTDIIGFSEGGVEAARINADSQFVAAAGTAALPVITTTGDLNTGIFFPAADTIAFSEGGVEAMRIDSSANLQFNSGYGSVATAYGCRAWVNFNGTGTVAIRASGNVTSITDNASGDYTINFTTAMPDANYSFTSAMDWGNTAFGASARTSCIVSLATSNARMRTGFLDASAVFTAEDEAIICVSIFR
jgi:hypothetical protein